MSIAALVVLAGTGFAQDTGWGTPVVGETIESVAVGTMVWVPDGAFVMGSAPGSLGHDSDEGQHDEEVEGFWMMQHEVTQRQWVTVMGHNPSLFMRCLDCPVESVSWNDAVAFAALVSELEGVSYRLPTEVEWEWAARGGQDTLYAGSDDAWTVAWTRKTSADWRRPHPVCALDPNDFGLCDMSGNVWEWVGDWYAMYAQQMMPGRSSPSTRVYRGGGWIDPPQSARVSERAWTFPEDANAFTGFRLVREE
jgi:formylglycine-generating enzyme required for sulfatase activity